MVLLHVLAEVLVRVTAMSCKLAQMSSFFFTIRSFSSHTVNLECTIALFIECEE